MQTVTRSLAQKLVRNVGRPFHELVEITAQRAGWYRLRFVDGYNTLVNRRWVE